MDIKKAIAKAGAGVWEDMASMGEEALRGEVLKAQASIREVEAAQEADEELTRAKDTVRELRAPYTDALKSQKARTFLALYRLDELGKAPEADAAGDEG